MKANPSTLLFLLAFGFVSGLGTSARAGAPATNPAPHRFEREVAAYEAADKVEAPPKNAILLAGDSQFYRWKTFKEDLAGYTVVNRGIDSFETSDLVYFAQRLVIVHHPRLIVTHIGGNDVHVKKTPERVLADFQAFVAAVRTTLPDVPIIFSSTTPGPARIDEWDARKVANERIKAYIATQKNLGYIDLWDAMLTPDGKAREDIWVADRVHPNHEGYLIRVKLTLPFLGEPDMKPAGK